MSDETEGGLQAMQRMKKMINEVEVDPPSYDYVNTEIQKVTFVKWHEQTLVNKHIGIVNFPDFMEDLHRALELPDKEYRQLLLIYKHMQQGDVKKLEVNYNSGKLDTRYVFFAVNKREELTDMVYAMYILDAKEEKVTEGVQMNTMGRLQTDPRVNAFFRYKAVEGFACEGLADRPSKPSPTTKATAKSKSWCIIS